LNRISLWFSDLLRLVTATHEMPKGEKVLTQSKGKEEAYSGAGVLALKVGSWDTGTETWFDCVL